MSLNFNQIVDQTVTKPYADKSVSKDALKNLWILSLKFVEETLLLKKAVNFPNFGIFTLNISKVDLARSVAKETVQPTYIAASQFTQAAGIPAKKNPIQNQLPVTQLNVTRISLESGLSRDQVDTSLKAILRAMQEAVRNGSTVTADLTFGTFKANSEAATVKFTPRFTQLLQELDDVDKPKHLRTVTNPELVPDAEAAKTLLARSRNFASPTNTGQAYTTGGSNGNSLNNSGNYNTTGNRDSPVGSRGAGREASTPPANRSFSAPPTETRKSQSLTNTGSRRKEPNPEDILEDPDYCVVCRANLAALTEKELARHRERELEEKLKRIAHEKDMADKREAARQAEIARKRRAEIDEFNKPLMGTKRDVERPETYGDLFQNRTEQKQIGHIDKNSYQQQLQEQMREKELRLKREAEEARREAAEQNRRAVEEFQRDERRQWEARRAANEGNKTFLKEQMAMKNEFQPAVLAAAETQFMGNRLVSTAELKQRQHADAKARADLQLNTIHEKDLIRQREREAAIAEGEAERQAVHEALKRQKKEEELRKLQAQKDAAQALLDQIQENKLKKQQEEMETKMASAYFKVGDHDHDDHSAHCKKCGKTLKAPKEANRTKTTLIPATRAY